VSNSSYSLKKNELSISHLCSFITTKTEQQQTSGAKIFSDLAGAPTDKPLLDTDPALYEIQKEQQSKAPYQAFQKVDTA
jgi:hypothetical protein